MAQQPMYQQIADDLRERIDDGTLAPGSQLPTEMNSASSTTRHETPSGTRSSGLPARA